MQSPDSPFIKPSNPFQRRLVQAVAMAKPNLRGVGMTSRTLPGGTSIVIAKQQRAARTVRPFQLIRTSSGGIRVAISTLDDDTPDFPDAETAFSVGDTPPCVFIPLTDTGYLYAHVEWDEDGEIITRELAFAEEVPDNDDTNCYYQIGSWVADSGNVQALANTSYGPLTICRDWYSNPITYSIGGHS